jgi:hypothetical protein
MLKRQCTNHFKLRPIRKEVRRLLGLRPRQRAPKGAVEQCVGISLDEARRMQLSREQMTVLSYPFVKMSMTRSHCEKWLAENYAGLKVPKSSCIGCPFHSDMEWLNIRSITEEWKQAVELDNTIRTAGINRSYLSGLLFLHDSRIPLEEVELIPTNKLPLIQLCQPTRQEEFINHLSIYSDEA